MRSLSSSLARRALLIGALTSLSLAPAVAAPPLPRPKPAIVWLKPEVEPARVAAPAPVVDTDSIKQAEVARDAAVAVWLSYRVTWLLALVGLAVIALSIWQAFAARESSRRQLRAYLSLRPGAAPHLDADWTDATIVLKNNGQTPAFAVDFTKAKLGRPHHMKFTAKPAQQVALARANTATY